MSHEVDKGSQTYCIITGIKQSLLSITTSYSLIQYDNTCLLCRHATAGTKGCCINVVWRLQRAPECWQLLARPFAVDYSWTVFIVRSVRPWHSALHPLAHCPSCPLPLWHSLQIPRLQYTTVAQGQYRQNRHPATQKTRPHGDKQTDRERERERQTWGQYYKRCLTLV